MCAHAGLFRDGNTQLYKVQGSKTISAIVSNVILVTIWSFFFLLKNKSCKSVCDASRFTDTCSIVEQDSGKKTKNKNPAGHILCRRGVIYESWNWIPRSGRRSAATTRRSESEEGGKAAHNKETSKETGKYMCRQKYTLPARKKLCPTCLWCPLGVFPAIFQPEQSELFQIFGLP